MKKLKGVISVFAVSLCLLSPAQAEEQRYISIRNTDMVWVPGDVCVWQFRLDNGGSGEGFGPLTLSLRLKDKGGNTLVMGNMAVAPLPTPSYVECSNSRMMQRPSADVSVP